MTYVQTVPTSEFYALPYGKFIQTPAVFQCPPSTQNMDASCLNQLLDLHIQALYQTYYRLRAICDTGANGANFFSDVWI